MPDEESGELAEPIRIDVESMQPKRNSGNSTKAKNNKLRISPVTQTKATKILP